MAIRILKIHTLTTSFPIHLTSDRNPLCLQVCLPLRHLFRISDSQTDMLSQTGRPLVVRTKLRKNRRAGSMARYHPVRRIDVGSSFSQPEEEQGGVTKGETGTPFLFINSNHAWSSPQYGASTRKISNSM
ncbi:uncharacterized protein ATNIH1004_003691 [Aspergillus tanneri]|uniref:Uncharacterized protein n=1 Tax=Aspergillus tanneri TaxID=1220188 RepID=A0A5M9N066_9EURO|nr:uncharacterized protein ATNIH1004_003691 [Aspergillus tanneri]KAA8651000.1 hypothetical protein ATNIH1004_003691 [Aspergillus tanneri]